MVKPALTTRYKVEDLQRLKSSKKKKRKKENATIWYAARGSGPHYQLILLLVWKQRKQLDVRLIDCLWDGGEYFSLGNSFVSSKKKKW